MLAYNCLLFVSSPKILTMDWTCWITLLAWEAEEEALTMLLFIANSAHNATPQHALRRPGEKIEREREGEKMVREREGKKIERDREGKKIEREREKGRRW